MNHLMIDLETMGTRFDAPILAIGAVQFDPDTGKIGAKFYHRVSIDDSFKFGKPSGSTVKWWMQQGDAARKEVVSGSSPLRDALEKLKGLVFDGTQVWGNGSTFDISILEYAYGRCLSEPAPWKFWNVRDCRTISELCKGALEVSDVKRDADETAHTAIGDALYQARWVSAMWRHLRGQPKSELVSDDMI